MTPSALTDTEHLRLHIVEMVRNQGGDVRPSPGLTRLDSRQRDRPGKLDSSKNVGVTGIPNEQGHIQFNPDNYRTPSTQHQAPSSAYSSKNRAAAWLIRRFHKRQDRHADSGQQNKNAKYERANGQQFGQTDSNFIDLAAGKSGRFEGTMGSSWKDNGPKLPPTSAQQRPALLESNLTNARSEVKGHETIPRPVTRHPSNLTTQGKGGNPVKAIIHGMHRGDYDLNSDPRKDKPRGVNKLQDMSPAAPVFLKHDRRQGIFSASLENFKKRLQMASNKMDALDDDKENASAKIIDLRDYSSLNHVPRPPSGLPRHQSDAHVTSKSKPASGKKVRPETESLTIINASAKLAQTTDDPTARDKIHPSTRDIHGAVKSGKRTPLVEDTPFSVDFTQRMRKPLSRIVENDADELFNRPDLLRKGRVAPAPLTVHNLRVHDSLQSAHERRMKRLNPRPPSQFQLHQRDDDGGVFVATPGDRMWQWLDEVVNEAAVESPVVTFLALQSGRTFYAMFYTIVTFSIKETTYQVLNYELSDTDGGNRLNGHPDRQMAGVNGASDLRQ
ncbi:hypothetical protein Btru_002365 [Bulinus truncatus]|nr:hypothetical protein Btru_002365 [Bulinus truncatus]